jgi:DNA-binding MarR family transcriptional regulator
MTETSKIEPGATKEQLKILRLALLRGGEIYPIIHYKPQTATRIVNNMYRRNLVMRIGSRVLVSPHGINVIETKGRKNAIRSEE